MNTDIRLQISFKENRKRKRLNLKLGPEAVLALVDLWLGVAVSRPCGRLAGWDELDVALEANYPGDPKEFVDALVEVGFLDKDESGTYSMHDWQEHNPYAAGSKERSDKARFSKLKSHYPYLYETLHEKGKRSISSNDYQRIVNEYLREREGDVDASSAPSPSPSPSPSPTPTPTPTEDIGATPSDAPSGGQTPPCMHQEIIEAYNEILPELTSVKKELWGGKRQDLLRARWKEKPERQNLQWWIDYFSFVRNSDFLMGRSNGFQADMEWIIRPSNMVKILEGKYNNNDKNKRFAPRNQREQHNTMTADFARELLQERKDAIKRKNADKHTKSLEHKA